MDKKTAKKAEPSVWRKRLDRFWVTLFLTPEGRPKSAMLMYAFCLCFVLFALYGLSYYFLIDGLEYLLKSINAVWFKNALMTLLPGLIGTAVCLLFWFLTKDKRILPVAYVWLGILSILSLAGMYFVCLDDLEVFRIFWYFFVRLVPVGLISGIVCTQIIYRKWKLKEDQNDKALGKLSD
ncbi:MAG: hypothetical protein LBQ95_07615 [Lachnospiraceae bacterium]|jgi:hypothetical protein|nr:hypothetical protein [Lachnospiraceae bacterium]